MRGCPSTSTSTAKVRNWKRMRSAASADAMRYGSRFSSRSRMRTKRTYAPTLLVLRKTWLLTTPMSTPRHFPSTASLSASAASVLTPRSRAKWFSVPPGRIASSAGVSSSSAAAVAMVPSPPLTSTRVAPSLTTSRIVLAIASGSTAWTSNASPSSKTLRASSAVPEATFTMAGMRPLTSAAGSDELTDSRPEAAPGRRQRDGRLSLELSPSLQSAAQRCGERAQHHPVHHLPVREALEKDEPGEALVLVLLHQEGNDRGEEVDDEKDRIEPQHLLQVRPGIRQPLVGRLHAGVHPDRHETPYEHQVGDG